MKRETGPRHTGDSMVFWGCVALALGLHALLLSSPPVLRGGADLLPHLRLIQQMGDSPGLRTIYGPGFHVLGALLAPLTGLVWIPKLVALIGVALLLAGFRYFQRAAGLPAASAALFALFPYAFTFSWCLPKIEALGSGLAFFGLGLLVQRRYAMTAALLAGTFLFHTASAFFFGITGGLLALLNRDARGIAALAVGSLAAAPLFAAHVADGCSLAEALGFSADTYLRATAAWSSLPILDRIIALANPVLLVLAGFGARPLWHRDRALAITCTALTLLYLNEIWLAPLEMRTSLDLLRGLSTLAFPVAVAAGVALEEQAPRWRAAIVCACALWAIYAALTIVPNTCQSREIRLEETVGLEVDRCRMGWRHAAPGSPARIPRLDQRQGQTDTHGTPITENAPKIKR